MTLSLVVPGVSTADSHRLACSSRRFGSTAELVGSMPTRAATCRLLNARRGWAHGEKPSTAGIHPDCAAADLRIQAGSAAERGAATAPATAAPSSGSNRGTTRRSTSTPPGVGRQSPQPDRAAPSRTGAAGNTAGTGRSKVATPLRMRPPVPQGAGRIARGAAGYVSPHRPRGGEVDGRPSSDRALLACPTPTHLRWRQSAVVGLSHVPTQPSSDPTTAEQVP